MNSTLVNWSQYIAARSVLGFMHCFDINQNLHTAKAIGSLVYRMNTKRRQRTIDNIKRSLPELSSSDIKRIAERSYQHMLQLFMVDAIAGPKLVTPQNWSKYVFAGELKSALELLHKGGPAILITGHFGNWELLAQLLAVLGFPVHALARPIDNPLINKWLIEMRESRGTRIITKWGAMPIVQDILKDNGRVAFIADQNAGDQGLFVPFFGRLASSYKSIALLAMQYEIPIIAGGARRIGDAFNYELNVTDIIKPEDWVDQDDPVFYLTARYNKAIETMVRAAPEQYLWIHRRWKSRPRHERQGKPFPTKLAAKIEALPWMTKAEFDRILADSD